MSISFLFSAFYLEAALLHPVLYFGLSPPWQTHCCSLAVFIFRHFTKARDLFRITILPLHFYSFVAYWLLYPIYKVYVFSEKINIFRQRRESGFARWESRLQRERTFRLKYIRFRVIETSKAYDDVALKAFASESFILLDELDYRLSVN